MKKLVLLTAIFLPHSAYCTEKHWDKHQVKQYVHNSDLQLRSNMQHISNNLNAFIKAKSVLDIGSGDGRMSSIVSNLVSGQVIGLEPNSNMLSWAKSQYCVEDYPNISFQKGSYSSINYENKFDLVTGFFSFHILDPEKRDDALVAIHKSLRSGGSLVMTIPPSFEGNPEFSQAVGTTLFSKKWKKYFENRKASFKFETLTQLKKRFFNSPFSNVAVNFKESRDPFVGKNEFVNWILGTMDFIQDVPSELRSKLASEIIEEYVRLRPDALSKDDIYYASWGRIEVFAVK